MLGCIFTINKPDKEASGIAINENENICPPFYIPNIFTAKFGKIELKAPLPIKVKIISVEYIGPDSLLEFMKSTVID